MNFLVPDCLDEWLKSTVSSLSMIRFRVVFAVIWLVYDVLDLLLGGTQTPFWFYRDRTLPHLIMACQVGLILCELSLIIGIGPRRCLIFACLFRAVEAAIFPLNDFLYYCVTALLLAHFDCSYLGKKGEGQRWVRDVMIGETAWIYLSTAVLKLNPSWLSGGDLYARQMFQISSHNWAYPEFYKTFMRSLRVNEALAWVGVVGEFALAFILIYVCLGGKRKKWAASGGAVLVILLHGFAAIALNVWFFGASMIAQVIFLTQVMTTHRSFQGMLAGQYQRTL